MKYEVGYYPTFYVIIAIGDIMKFENEITVEVDTDLDSLFSILESNGLTKVEEYDLKDIYLINKNDKNNDYLTMLSKCVLIRQIIEEDKERKLLTYKYKEYNEQKEITKQGKIDVAIDDPDKTKSLFEILGFEELIHLDDHLLVFVSDEDEFVVQCVNDKHIYIEIEEKCNRINKTYNSIDEMKNVLKKYNIPIKGNNYFVKKAEIELQEVYNK